MSGKELLVYPGSQAETDSSLHVCSTVLSVALYEYLYRSVHTFIAGCLHQAALVQCTPSCCEHGLFVLIKHDRVSKVSIFLAQLLQPSSTRADCSEYLGAHRRSLLFFYRQRKEGSEIGEEGFETLQYCKMSSLVGVLPLMITHTLNGVRRRRR